MRPLSDDLRLTLVRHGETTGESSIRYHGATDVPLSELGEQQMRLVARALGDRCFDRVLTSELVRTRRAAEIIAPESPAEAWRGFNEIDFGRWEGLTRGEIEVRDADLYRRWRADPSAFHFPGGESRAALVERVTATADRLFADVVAGDWLVLAHRGVISVLLDHLLTGQPCAPAEIALASVHTLIRRSGAWYAERLDFVASD